jgi:hypothetical protein
MATNNNIYLDPTNVPLNSAVDLLALLLHEMTHLEGIQDTDWARLFPGEDPGDGSSNWITGLIRKTCW